MRAISAEIEIGREFGSDALREAWVRKSCGSQAEVVRPSEETTAGAVGSNVAVVTSFESAPRGSFSFRVSYPQPLIVSDK
jgi:hypothetical protein